MVSLLFRTPIRRLLAGLATAATIAAACAGCGGNDGGVGPTQPIAAPGPHLNEQRTDGFPHIGGTLIYGVNADTNSWNPAQAQWGSYSMIEARTMFEFLTEYDEHGVIKPSLAKSLSPNDDYTTWTIRLRDGVKYANGQPLTAAEVVRAQRYIKASPVVGEAFGLIDDWQVLDDLTFEVRGRKPFVTLPEVMLSQVGAVAWPEWLESGDWEHPVGTGPFQISKWELGDELTVTRNPYYWRKDEYGNRYPYLDRIDFRVITDEMARAEALRNGDIDIMLQTFATPSVALLREDARAGRFQSFSDETFETSEDHVVLNAQKPPFDDIDARRALAYATDQAEYLSAITGGLNQAADGPLAPNSPWYTPTGYPAYDPGKAKELVDKVKARHGGRFEFELVTQPTPESTRVQQYLVDMWARVGIEAKPKEVDTKAKIVGAIAGLAQATIMQLFDSPSVTNDTMFWAAHGKTSEQYSLQFSRLPDPELRVFDEINGAPDLATRRALVGELQKRMGELVPYIWLAHVSRTVVASTRLRNVVHHRLPDGSIGLDFMQGSHPLYQVWMVT